MDSSSLAVKAVKRIDFYIDSLTTVRTSLQKVVDPPVKNPNDVHTSNHCNELHSCTEFFSEVCWLDVHMVYTCIMYTHAVCMQSCINNCVRYAFWPFLRPPTWWMLSKASKHVTKVRYYWLGVWYSLINLQNAEWLPIFTIHGKEVVAWHVLCQTCAPTNTICRPSLPMPISTCITWPASIPWRSTRSTLTLKADSQQEVFDLPWTSNLKKMLKLMNKWKPVFHHLVLEKYWLVPKPSKILRCQWTNIRLQILTEP